MVRAASRAEKRTFTVEEMLRESSAYNVRKAPQWVAERLFKSKGKCSSAKVHADLKHKTFAHIRRELNKKLAASLAARKHEAAFAKACAVDSRPRADELEKMIKSFPGEVDWSAKPVKSGINTGLWRAWHARHCCKCSPTKVDDGCYFRTIDHFLRTGVSRLPIKWKAQEVSYHMGCSQNQCGRTPSNGTGIANGRRQRLAKCRVETVNGTHPRCGTTCNIVQKRVNRRLSLASGRC